MAHSASSEAAARLVASKMLRTSAYHRPNPSLLFFPGLNTQPFHKPSNFGFVKDFEASTDTIKEEYLKLRAVYGEKGDDYTK